MSLRALRRAVTLAGVLALCIPRLWLYRLRGPLTLVRRAQWGRETGKQIIAALGIRITVSGPIPERGILVANHLSYLDILIFGTAVPCFFVSKAEIGKWPFFGWMSRSGGTIYIHRASRASAEEVNAEVASRLHLPVMVLFFPEGTSTDGSAVLRFHSRLFTPAIEQAAPVTAAAVRYVPDDGGPERDFCWFGDEAFLPHILRTLGGPGFTAQVSFSESRTYPDRRTAARITYAEIVAMREAGTPSHQELVGGRSR